MKTDLEILAVLGKYRYKYHVCVYYLQGETTPTIVLPNEFINYLDKQERYRAFRLLLDMEEGRLDKSILNQFDAEEM